MTPSQRALYNAFKAASAELFDRLKADPTLPTIDHGDGTMTIRMRKAFMLDENGDLKPEYKQ